MGESGEGPAQWLRRQREETGSADLVGCRYEEPDGADRRRAVASRMARLKSNAKKYQIFSTQHLTVLTIGAITYSEQRKRNRRCKTWTSKVPIPESICSVIRSDAAAWIEIFRIWKNRWGWCQVFYENL